MSAGTKLTLFVIYICVFALMSPIGIAIGIGIGELAAGGSVGYTATTGILSGISAGCIIYVVVFEVLQRERSKTTIRPKIVQFLALVVGFATMMTVDLLSKEKTQRIWNTAETVYRATGYRLNWDIG